MPNHDGTSKIKTNNYYEIADSDQESDPDMHEWENQQIRKGVTGAQVRNESKWSNVNDDLNRFESFSN